MRKLYLKLVRLFISIGVRSGRASALTPRLKKRSRMFHRMLEHMAYVIAKGVARAWFDVRRDQHLVPNDRTLTNDEDAMSARNVITNTGLKDYFDTIVISGELGVEKPDRRIFEVALKSLGVKAENAVMVGNRVDADIVGANRSGMTSVWFKWNNRYPASINACEKKPDFTIRSLFELPNVLGLP